MNRIEFEKIRFKNFLSYGSRWQEIKFKKGLNLVVGKDNDTGKSNGSGKSSLMETLSFALFGVIHTDVTQSDIINWKNRKGTEVQAFFKKGSNEYKVYRSLKPNGLEIYKNETLIEPPSHIKYYQEQLEEILGFNKQTFSKIVHSNINSSNPILSMKKAEKRAFMEKIFGLEVYSKLNTLGNEKLKGAKDQVRELELQIDSCNSTISNLQDMNKSLKTKISDIEEDSNDDLNNLEINLKLHKKMSISKVEYNILKKEYEENVVEIEEKKRLLNELNTKTDMLERQIDKLEKVLKIKTKKKVPTEEQIQQKIIIIEEEIEKFEQLEKNSYGLVSDTLAEINLLSKQEKELSNFDKCPTCGQDIPEGIVTSLSDKISEKQERLVDLKVGYEQQKKNVKESKEKKVKLLKLEKACDIVRRDNVEIEKSEGELDALTTEIRVYNDNKIPLARRITYLDIKLKDEKNEIDKYEENTKIVEKLKSEIDYIKKKRILIEQKKTEYNDLIKENDEKVVKEQKLVSEKDKEIKDLNDLVDYYKYIKDVCADENAKSLAISKLRPLLVKETNTYLSDIGFNFYIMLDDWLNATIKGPGITNGNYKSLSNGEKRTVDLALQNAFLSINRIQAGVLPDILIYDEVLDSSVDETSLSKILEIIRNKEIEDELKVFIISHRDNVAEMADIDNIYSVVKSKGYSTVEVK